LYHAYGAGTAAKLAVGAIATVYLVQSVLHVAGVPDVVASGASDVVVLALLLAVAHASGGAGRLGLGRPRARFLVAGLLVGVSSWYPSLVLVTWLVAKVGLPHDTEILEQLTRQPPLAVTLVVLAVLPAIAEEMIFRGLLARGLATRLGVFWAILISAAAFGLYHLNPVQMIPTFLLGLALGVIAVRGDSILETMLAHALNNTVAIVLSRDALPSANDWIDAHQGGMLGATLAVLLAGVALAVPRAKGAA
jgi:membrane protease YdiL (CAAX protease family)